MGIAVAKMDGTNSILIVYRMDSMRGTSPTKRPLPQNTHTPHTHTHTRATSDSRSRQHMQARAPTGSSGLCVFDYEEKVRSMGACSSESIASMSILASSA